MLKYSEANHPDFLKIWQTLSQDDWTFIQEMEGMCSSLASYALNEAQSNHISAANKAFYRTLSIDFTNPDHKFKILSLDCPKDGKATFGTHTRFEKKESEC